jgi:hypothetical protein
VENIIDELYAGELIDYLKCIDIDHESERYDKFLDFALAIVPFGCTEALHSIADCIETYLQPEILDGDNQYYAESVGYKVDAIKGLKFKKLPNIMSIQLKRFLFDFSGPNIVQKKVNDMVSFPMLLDMNKYVSKKKKKSVSTENERTDSEINENEVEDEFELFLKEKTKDLRKKQEIQKLEELNKQNEIENNKRIFFENHEKNYKETNDHDDNTNNHDNNNTNNEDNMDTETEKHTGIISENYDTKNNGYDDVYFDNEIPVAVGVPLEYNDDNDNHGIDNVEVLNILNTVVIPVYSADNIDNIRNPDIHKPQISDLGNNYNDIKNAPNRNDSDNKNDNDIDIDNKDVDSDKKNDMSEWEKRMPDQSVIGN